MTAGSGLAGAPLARTVFARWSWCPAGTRGVPGLLGDLVERRSSMLAHAQSLEVWHESPARRWRPLDTTIPPARTTVGDGPLSTGVMTVSSKPVATHGPEMTARSAAPADGTVTPRRSPDPGPARGAADRGRVPRVRITSVFGAGPRVQRLPMAVPAPARPALTLAALAAAAATAAGPLPVPFRPATPDTAMGGPMVVPAIGQRFARRELVGGFPEVPAGGPAGDRGARSAARPMAPPVRWRVVDGRPADNASRRAAEAPQAIDADGGLPVAPALPAQWTERPFPVHQTEPEPDRRIHGAGLAERLGAAAPVALPGLSLRVVPPEEAARRLAAAEDPDGGRAEAPGARDEAGVRREVPPAPPQPAINIDAIVERVQRELQRRERFERERKGLF